MDSIIFSKSPRSVITIGILSYEHLVMVLKNTPTECKISVYYTEKDKNLLNLKEKFKDFTRISVEYGDNNWLDNIIMGDVDIIHSNVEINPLKYLNLLSKKGIIILEGVDIPPSDLKIFKTGNLTIIKE
jgi:hypothetical protein